jgi:hypothetical protein
VPSTTHILCVPFRTKGKPTRLKQINSNEQVTDAMADTAHDVNVHTIDPNLKKKRKKEEETKKEV